MGWKKPKAARCGQKQSKPKKPELTETELSRYMDISWLMSKVDPLLVLERLGAKVFRKTGDQIDGWCPDHHLFVGKDSSHPKWSLNIKTGQTNCFTEGRGSNLLWIVCRLRKCSPEKAAEWMLGEEGNIDVAILDKMKRDFTKFSTKAEEKKEDKFPTFPEVEDWIEKEKMLDSGYHYFMYPPKPKRPTLIEKETVDYYRCIQLTNGRYNNRIIIPFFVDKKLVGYEAVDVLGKDKWLLKHPISTEEQYRKVLYPTGFRRKLTLFGIDELTCGEDVVLVEGARDVMKLRQIGYYAVGILGSDISDEQIMLLAKRNPSRVGLFFDGDRAGRDITKKCKKKLDEFFVTESIETPFKRDPKDLEVDVVKKLLSNFRFIEKSA